MNIIKELKTIQDKIKKVADKYLEKISLHLVFVLGIGLTSLMAKLLFKQFITKKYHFSSWQKHQTRTTFNKMY